MKITDIKVLNVLGNRRVDVHLTKPIALIGGRNGAGKSSLQECVRMALLGDVLRVDNKKDYPLMVADGAKTGSILITTDGSFQNSVQLPKGEIVTAEYGYPREVMASVLNAQSFAALLPEQRRKFLFDLTGCHATNEKVRVLLADRNCDPARVEAAIPMLRAGFPDACELSKKKATEAKGAWRATTGETYGSLKGVDWKASAPEVDQAALTQATANVAALDVKLTELRREIAILEGKAAEQKKNAGKLTEARAEAGKLQSRREKLAFDEKALIDAQKNLESVQARAGTGRRKGLLHEMASFLNVVELQSEKDAALAGELIARYETEHGEIGATGDADAIEQLPILTNARDMLQRAVNNDKRDIASAEAAEQLIAALAQTDDASEAGSSVQLQTDLKALLEQRDEAAKVQDALNRDAYAAANAGERTTKAAGYHTDVIEWTKIAEAFSPEGIPGELLATALKPINNHLRKSATDSNWMQVAINPDMTIRANNRLYALLSESEKWRCDAMIADAIAQLSDIRILMLDRVDVLDVQGREDLLYWLDMQAANGGLQSVLLFGTFKTKPTGLPDSIESLWVENGELSTPVEQPELEAA